MTTVDWIALAVVFLATLGGWRRGLVGSALSLGGLLVGAYLGSRIAPHLLDGGARSPWTPFAGLVGALVGAALLQTLAGIAGAFVRGGLRLGPLRLVDSVGGVVFGVGMGLVLVWIGGATALLLPGQTALRREVLHSTIVRRLNDAVPPQRLLHLLVRIDPFPSITGPAAPSSPAAPAIVRKLGVRRAAGSVVKIFGTSCGIGVEGSGWFITRDLVVTAAHVVAGQRDTRVQFARLLEPHPADAVAFDARNDVAILRVEGASHTPLRLGAPRAGTAVAILGYPENGPLTATPARIGTTATVLSRDAYGRGPVARTMTAVAGRVEHGDSGGPAVDEHGVVRSTIFAARVGAPTGYGVPASLVRRALRSVQGRVSTGSCAG